MEIKFRRGIPVSTPGSRKEDGLSRFFAGGTAVERFVERSFAVFRNLLRVERAVERAVGRSFALFRD